MHVAFIFRSRWCLRQTLVCLLVSSLLTVLQSADCAARIGLAEWSIETPGKNFLANSDLFTNQGICLHRPATGGALDNKAVCVSHIQWWMYYEGHVVGKAKKGLFLFDERSRETRYFENQASLDGGMKQLKLEKPRSRRFVPQDGWNLGVGAVLVGAYQQRLKELKEGSGEAQQLGPAERESLIRSLNDMLKRLETQVAASAAKLDGGQEKTAAPVKSK